MLAFLKRKIFITTSILHFQKFWSVFTELKLTSHFFPLVILIHSPVELARVRRSPRRGDLEPHSLKELAMRWCSLPYEEDQFSFRLS